MPHGKGFGKEVARFKDEIDHLFIRFFDMDFPVATRFFGQGKWAPRVYVSDGKADIPGCEVEDIDVDVASIRASIKITSSPPIMA